MKVISGILKGRRIEGYDIEGTRPTMDRVKMSIFGSIQDYVKDSIVLDLYAGSGNLGIEAISNGASICYFIDHNKKCIDIIHHNLRNFKVSDKAVVLYQDSLKFLKDTKEKFDIIFIDPPYQYSSLNKVFHKIDEYQVLNNNGLLVIEYQIDSIRDIPSYYTLIKNKKYGDKYVSIYQLKNNK